MLSPLMMNVEKQCSLAPLHIWSNRLKRSHSDSAFGRIEDFLKRKVKQLLVVEDDEQQRMAIMSLVGNGDIETHAAATAEEALARSKRTTF